MKDETIEKRAGFTPGPWKVGNYNCIMGTIFSVAVAIDLPGQDEKEKQANARLIAQAPAMYDMLREVSKVLDGLEAIGANLPYYHKENIGMSDKLRELLAKVDGGEG